MNGTSRGRTPRRLRERRRAFFVRTLFPDRVGRKKKKWLETFTATKCRFFKSKASVFYEDIFSLASSVGNRKNGWVGFKNKNKRNLKIRFILIFKWSVIGASMNLFETDENAEIRRNVAFLLSTYKYSCAMARDFGLAAIFIDKPNARAESIARDEIEQALKTYEPRAEIDEISFTYENGKMMPIVIIKNQS